MVPSAAVHSRTRSFSTVMVRLFFQDRIDKRLLNTAHVTRRFPNQARRTAMQAKTTPKKPRQETSDSNCSTTCSNTPPRRPVAIHWCRHTLFRGFARCSLLVESPRAQLEGWRGGSQRRVSGEVSTPKNFSELTIRTRTRIDVLALPRAQVNSDLVNALTPLARSVGR